MLAAKIRAARKNDCRTIAELYRIASEGVSDYIWANLAQPGEDLLDVGQRRYEREDSVFSFRSTSIAERDGLVAGMLVAFPMVVDENHVEEDPVLAPYSKLEEPESFYICAMAVFPQYRGQGIGHHLLEHAEACARKLELRKLSLIVFEENAGAKRLYERTGFEERTRAPIVPHPLIHHKGDALLMVRNLR